MENHHIGWGTCRQVGVEFSESGPIDHKGFNLYLILGGVEGIGQRLDDATLTIGLLKILVLAKVVKAIAKEGA